MLDLTGYWDNPTGTASPGHYQMQLFPSDPQLVASLNTPEPTPPGVWNNLDTVSPDPIRIRAIDIENWRSTHLVEDWSLLGLNGQVPDSYRLVFESPRTTRWLAVVTAGPLWGCFLFDAARDEQHWPTALYQLSPDSVPRPSPTDIDSFAGIPPPFANTRSTAAFETARVCVDANERSIVLRSGEIVATGLSSITAGIPLGPRGSYVQWAPAYGTEPSEFQLRAIRLGGSDDQPDHTYQVTSRARTDGRQIYRAVLGQALEINAGAYATYTALPRPGSWLLVATAQPTNWGCFLLTARHMHDAYSANSSNPR